MLARASAVWSRCRLADGPHRRYKRVLDEGFALDYGHGMQLEAENYRRHLSKVTKEKMEAQRDATMARNRQQSAL